MAHGSTRRCESKRTVPDDNLIGKAFTIWMHWDWEKGFDLRRIGMSID